MKPVTSCEGAGDSRAARTGDVRCECEREQSDIAVSEVDGFVFIDASRKGWSFTGLLAHPPRAPSYRHARIGRHMIEARNLTKIFRDKKRGEIRAADDVSFRAEPGCIYGLLGANGAGKTTTLRLLATLLKPTKGSATVAGFDVERDPGKVRAHVGFLAASTALYGRLTAREMITYFGQLNGLSSADLRSRIQRLADDLDMHEFLDRRCEKFSTGMKQKTSIARTLVHDPAVMIFDEPTLGLDVMTSRAIVKFVRDCRDRGKTVIYSTHIMSEVDKLCDRVGIIHDGRLLAEGSPAELRARYGEQDLEEIFVKVVGSI